MRTLSAGASGEPAALVSQLIMGAGTTTVLTPLVDQGLKVVFVAVGAVFVLDCIASGTYWVDMKALGIDVVITAPQKGWSGHAFAIVSLLTRRTWIWQASSQI